MARKLRVIAESGIYQIMLKGNDKLLFVDDFDYKKFLEMLKKMIERDFIEVYAFCLFEDCIQLAIKEGLCSISATVKDLISAFAIWCNAKYQRSGKLFYDRYASMPIESDAELMDVVRYIHRIPLERGYNLNYKFSSYNNYIKKSEIFSDGLLFLFDGSINFKIFMDNEPEGEYLTDRIKKRLTDEQLKIEIRILLDDATPDEIAQLKPEQFKILVKKFKQIEGAGIRQLARVLNLSRSFVEKC